MGGFTKLIEFLRDEKELSYKLLGIALDWQLVGRIIILVLSVAATLLQYYFAVEFFGLMSLNYSQPRFLILLHEGVAKLLATTKGRFDAF